MEKAPISKEEIKRLETLREYQILDTPPEDNFDSITSLVVSLLNVPIALISLVDEYRQWFKSSFGLNASETARDISFCGHAIDQDELFVVNDAQNAPRFSDNPLVVGEPKVGFYAGMPLIAPNGQKLGTLCAIDHKARTLNSDQDSVLREFAKSIANMLELRKKKILLEEVRSAAVALDMKFALVGQLNPVGTIIETDVFVMDGEVVDNFTYDLKGTPCENVYSGKRVCLYEESMARAFPEDLLLEEMSIESYIGAPFINPDPNQPDAIFVFLDTKPRLDSTFLKSSVEFLASQIGLEYFREDSQRVNLMLEETLDYFRGPCSIIDTQGKFLFVNKALGELIGREPAELVGAFPYDFFPESFSKNYRVSDRTVIETKKPLSEIGYSVDHAGNRLIFQTDRFPVFDRDQNVLAVVVVAVDITNIREKQIQEAHNSRLRELGEKIALVAHEINNPLAVVVSSLDLLAQNPNDPAVVKKRLNSLRKGIKKIREIVSELKNISRKEKDDFADINLVDLLDDFVDENYEYFQKNNTELKFECEESKMIKVLGSRTQLQQVMMNLFSNARDAMENKMEKVINTSLKVEGGQAIIRVKDVGDGIPPNISDKIFENFFTTKDPGKGTGIVLHFTRSVIQAHAGDIDIETTEPGGTTVKVKIPLLP